MDSKSAQSLHPDKEGAKFFVDASELVEQAAPLPSTYPDDRLVALVRDPFWFYVYWALTDTYMQHVRSQHGEDVFDRSEVILRVYDDTEGTNGHGGERFFDTSATLDAHAWYVKVDQSGRTYVAELGLRLSDNRFIALLRSNRIQMPLGRVSDETESDWAAVQHSPQTQEWRRVMEASGLDKIGAGSSGGSHQLNERVEEGTFLAQRWEFLRSVFSGSSARLSSSAPTSWNMPPSLKTPSSPTKDKDR